MALSLNPIPWRRNGAAAEKLYGAIVAQARLPLFYQAFGLPDTLEGRFSVLSLHLFAVLHRLGQGNDEALYLSQKLMDTFTADMETVLREIGVGDLSIPKKMRGLAASSTALLQSYAAAFAEGDEALAATIAETLPLDGDAAVASAQSLAPYLKEVVRKFEAQQISRLIAGKVNFPQISETSE
ncbi:MAG: ubiquinol-cytochrome C chaperone family protein [Methyloceanibacter sp.]